MRRNKICIILSYATPPACRFPPARSANELRLLYSMAIIRFVNGLVEKDQGAQAKSVAVLAENLGLPRMLVDLRHSATHQVLPSLPALRQGCITSLSWLNQTYVHSTLCLYRCAQCTCTCRYWSRQERQLVDVKTVVHHRLTRYQKYRFEPTEEGISMFLIIVWASRCLR